ncbi:protein of unknown function [Geodermatophilus saharensis]|uniref:DUF4394 domain-containing protein n=1 Tax=Geodermatophilus saharensis TaxID=1137994 RepID=A0A239F7W2_9ACTN|nr:DUF4394 domain-containing protein [Geodermatophilus saharensis]SNS52164.1 protein of unknown function [Geodermatophilus saharensis]
MRTRPTTALTLTAAALAVALAPATASAGDGRPSGWSAADRLTAIGLAGDRTLVRFDTDRPRDARPLGDVRGLAPADQELVGIDHRAADGSLYGVGRGGGVYTIDTRTLQATKALQLTVPLQGESFGVDVNPAADALRIVSDTGQNLRQPLATAGATVADTPLNPAPGTGVTGAAYTNNDRDPATATTLFDLATAADQVVVQAPANAGSLSPTGAAGVDLTGDTGFDVSSTVRQGSTVANAGWAVNAGRLHRVDLLTGRFTDAGRVGRGDVTDLSFPTGQR